jgi:two-component system, LuxR family, sensor kinase FixL
MTDYGGLSRTELIERLRALEGQIASDAVQTAERTIERKRHQAALRDSEERLRAILDTAVEGIITIDERGIIESVNAAAEKIFGYEAEELIGRNVSALMPNPYRREHDGYLANYARTGQARIIGIGREVVGQRKDGTVFPMDLSVSEVQLETRRLFTGFVRDITERKRLEQEVLEISDRERREIGHTLHDGLSQHLAGIELMSRVLEQNISKKSKAGAEQAAKIAEHVREAIGQTRMVARGLSPVSIEANGLMSALQELANSVSKMFAIECRFECPEPILISDNAVATHLYRIAQEAINNGIKHGKTKRVEIRLLRNDSGFIQLTATDWGKGFAKGASKNGGMGLQIMKYRANIIGASLNVHDSGNKGVRVVCTLKSGL